MKNKKENSGSYDFKPMQRAQGKTKNVDDKIIEMSVQAMRVYKQSIQNGDPGTFTAGYITGAKQMYIDVKNILNDVDTAFEVIRVSWDNPTPQAVNAINGPWQKIQKLFGRI